MEKKTVIIVDMEIQRLLEIAKDLELSDLVGELQELKGKDELSNCPLVFTLVGDFSSGKTTLINTLSDNKQLETAATPTTSTIYEVYFSQDRSYAEVYNDNEYVRTVDDIQNLKNAELKNSSLVKVYDTSKLVPSSIVLVDTPGLSSLDDNHTNTLVDYLPKTDGILLVCDICQQITASLIEFVMKMSIVSRPIYLVLTKCELKSPGEVEKARATAAINSGIPVEHIVCVSGINGKIDELQALFSTIQESKGIIFKRLYEQKLLNIRKRISDIVGDLITASSPDLHSMTKIDEYQQRIDNINREIRSIVDDLKSEIESVQTQSVSKYRERMFDQLETLSESDSFDFDTDAKSIVDTTTHFLLNEYKTSIQNIIVSNSRTTLKSDDSIDISGFTDYDIINTSLVDVPYNLNLNSLGHEYDKQISIGVKIVSKAVSIASSSGFSSDMIMKQAADWKSYAKLFADIAGIFINTGIHNMDDSVLSTVPSNNRWGSSYSLPIGVPGSLSLQNKQGLLDNLVGVVTDKSLGKPHRRKAIQEYLDFTLIPNYSKGLSKITAMVIDSFSDNVVARTSERLNELKKAISQAQKDYMENESAYLNRIHCLKGYLIELQ